MRPFYFATPSELRKWFEKNHKTVKELVLGYHKVGSGKPSVTWEQSVDEALCYGWIDGVRKGVDAQSYTIRFTPRRTGSFWSRRTSQAWSA
ncbi:MAG: YdeI/OmpD-associated family protein [Anaerolineales bacterium]